MRTLLVSIAIDEPEKRPLYELGKMHGAFGCELLVVSPVNQDALLDFITSLYRQAREHGLGESGELRLFAGRIDQI